MNSLMIYSVVFIVMALFAFLFGLGMPAGKAFFMAIGPVALVAFAVLIFRFDAEEVVKASKSYGDFPAFPRMLASIVPVMVVGAWLSLRLQRRRESPVATQPVAGATSGTKPHILIARDDR
jgi:hypothetical protein